MSYLYYPGCSLQTSASEYDVSAKAVMRALGQPLVEIEDWNCCGATAIEGSSYLLAMALPARTLALANKVGGQLVATCSSCFLNLFRVKAHVEKDPWLKPNLDSILAEIGLTYNPDLRVRHLLDVVVNDIGLEAVKERVRQKLSGLVVAPYYGCQIVRPYAEFDGPDLPTSMDQLITALGAEVLTPYMMKTRCCGGSLMTTKKSVATKLVGDILMAAREADCIVTVCPLCQLNLDAFQGSASRHVGVSLNVPVMYFTQLIGLAFDLPEEDLKLGNLIVPASKLLSHLRTQRKLANQQKVPAQSQSEVRR